VVRAPGSFGVENNWDCEPEAEAAGLRGVGGMILSSLQGDRMTMPRLFFA